MSGKKGSDGLKEQLKKIATPGAFVKAMAVMLLCYVVLWSNLGVSEEKVSSLIETSHYKNGVLHRLKGVYKEAK